MRVTDEQRRWRAAHRHRLTPAGRTDDVASIAADLVGLHASDPATVFLSVLSRMADPAIDRINQALYEARSVVRHHAMRRTIWVMTPEIARLAHGAATAKIAAAERKRTIAAIEESTEIADGEIWLDHAIAEVGDYLRAQGPQTTREIGKALPHLVVPVTFGVNTKNPASLNAHTKVLQGAGFDATFVRTAPTGGWHSAEYAWAVTDTWLDEPLAGGGEAESAAALLDRWLPRFGPATTVDISWWFGWTKTLTKKSLAAVGAIEVTLDDGEAAWLAADDLAPVDDPGPWVRLLPGLDPTVMGWKQRDWYLDPEMVGYLFDRFGNAGPTIWADGRVVGAWIQRADGTVATELTTSIDKDHQRLLDDAVAQLQDAVGDVVVKPRFPAPAQRALLAESA